MNAASARAVVASVGCCWLCLGLAAPPLAATTPDTARTPLFEPGQEYHVLTDNRAIGTQSFNLFVPRDYTNDREWPVIFRFKGRGDRYNPIICRSGRSNICDRGAVVVGMGYFPQPKGTVPHAQFRTYIALELKSMQEAKRLIAKYLRVDDERLFISGSSAGGWLATNLLEYRAQVWAGAMVFVAGRHASAAVLTNQASVRAFEGLPVFFGSTLPGASHGGNYPWAVKGAALYEQRGAIVTFQIYDDDWLVHCPLLRDWNRDFVLTGKNDSIARKRAKWQKLVREAQLEIDNPRTIKEQIAKQFEKQPDQLTTADLRAVQELSLIGQRVTDLSYLAQLPNLQSLDISFTYVDHVEPLRRCQHLRTLDISDTHIKDLAPLKGLPQLKTLRLWNLWLDRAHINRLKEHLPHLKVIDYQWDLYEKDPIGRILPRRKVKLN
ncbi:MAG: hypothetical protein JSW27_05825 [Phycisphaerales bacterium]|nr:MAG: hypothetical protein JSW27_05825 [Phycisphaerales bacterium]